MGLAHVCSLLLPCLAFCRTFVLWTPVVLQAASALTSPWLRLRPAPASPASSGAVSSSGRCRGDSGRPMGSPSAPSKLWAMRHRAARLAKCWPGSPLGRRLRRLRRASILIGHYIYPNEFAIGKQSNEAGGIFQLVEIISQPPRGAEPVKRHSKQATAWPRRVGLAGVPPPWALLG